MQNYIEKASKNIIIINNKIEDINKKYKPEYIKETKLDTPLSQFISSYVNPLIKLDSQNPQLLILLTNYLNSCKHIKMVFSKENYRSDEKESTPHCWWISNEVESIEVLLANIESLIQVLHKKEAKSLQNPSNAVDSPPSSLLRDYEAPCLEVTQLDAAVRKWGMGCLASSLFLGAAVLGRSHRLSQLFHSYAQRVKAPLFYTLADTPFAFTLTKLVMVNKRKDAAAQQGAEALYLYFQKKEIHHSGQPFQDDELRNSVFDSISKNEIAIPLAVVRKFENLTS